jgi:hypothetical protein
MYRVLGSITYNTHPNKEHWQNIPTGKPRVCKRFTWMKKLAILKQDTWWMTATGVHELTLNAVIDSIPDGEVLVIFSSHLESFIQPTQSITGLIINNLGGKCRP